MGWWAARPQYPRVMELWLCSPRATCCANASNPCACCAVGSSRSTCACSCACLTQELPLHQLAKHLSSGALRSFLRRSFRNTSKIACVKFRQQTTESQNFSHHTTTSYFFCLVPPISSIPLQPTIVNLMEKRHDAQTADLWDILLSPRNDS